jgi:hypothetical protein
MMGSAVEMLKAAVNNSGIEYFNNKPELCLGGHSKEQLLELIDMVEGDVTWKFAQEIRVMIAARIGQTNKITLGEQRWIDCFKELADKFEKRAVALKITLDEGATS